MTALVALPSDRCGACGGTTGEILVDEPALLRHGGYGATKRSTYERCPSCGWMRLRSVVEVRP